MSGYFLSKKLVDSTWQCFAEKQQKKSNVPNSLKVMKLNPGYLLIIFSTLTLTSGSVVNIIKLCEMKFSTFCSYLSLALT